uniref:Uncharacterized protein n=1 Tax=Magallana gigas TaxID=29159 RepID=K1Q0I0_MAGGI
MRSSRGTRWSAFNSSIHKTTTPASIFDDPDVTARLSPLVPENGATQCEASKAVFKDTTEPSLLKNLLSSTVKKEPMTTPFNQRNTAENVQTKQPLVATVLEGNDPLKAELPFKSYSACTASVSTPSYSPALDENWPPTLTDSTSLTANTEDSILTTFRRNNQRKFKALEKRFTEPRVVASREFEVLQSLQKRMALDLQQNSEELSKTAELKAAQTMNMVLGIVTAGCICVVFLIILLLNYCYFRNNPDLKQHHHSSRINAPTYDITEQWIYLNFAWLV